MHTLNDKCIVMSYTHTRACVHALHTHAHTRVLLYIHWMAFIFSDVNECDNTYHGCHHDCVNTNGSYVCICYDGFILTEDGRSCEGNVVDTNSR